MGFIGGHIAVTHRGERPNIVEAYDMSLHMRQQVYVQDFRFGATANLFTFASVIGAVGPFDAAFLSGGDRDWEQRVCARGLRRAYASDAIVFHPARTTFSAIVKKARRLVGQQALRARRASASPLDVAASELQDMLGQIFLNHRKKARARGFSHLGRHRAHHPASDDPRPGMVSDWPRRKDATIIG